MDRSVMPGPIAVGIALGLAVLALDGPVLGQGADARPRWLGTWFAASTARVDQAAATLSAAASRSAQALVIPPAVQAVAPGQQLPVGGQSALHFNNQTLRQIVRTSIGGNRARVVLSNTFGTSPLTIGAAHVAMREKESAIAPLSDRTLTFSGRPTITIPPGAAVYSDPVDLNFPALADLAVDLYLPGTTNTPSPVTMHNGARQTNYVSQTGNHVGVPALPVVATTPSWFILTRVEVMAPE